MRDAIKAKAITLFEEKGFSETSIQDIVEAMEVTKGTFYYYFSSKESLLMEIHLEYIEGILNEQAAIYEAPAKSSKEKLIDTVFLLVTKIKTQGPSAKIFYREMRHLNQESYENIAGKRNEFRWNLQRVIEDGVRDGEFQKGLRPSITALAVLGITNWSYQWFDPNGELLDEEVAQHFVELILQGIQIKE
ncbi:TetR/AcrR family transcriptional regulator [Shouchella shacheensis]|uniref:TetR/AcrR family transcriptional regulator n=1 Tax=Shouchella shacheensis TaxID=1649580 RepID=UPI0007402BE8|nr:TetR/AcrR family transcriptional regulator [Shouchella shacheensis]